MFDFTNNAINDASQQNCRSQQELPSSYISVYLLTNLLGTRYNCKACLCLHTDFIAVAINIIYQ